MRIVLPSYKILTPMNRFEEDLRIIEEVGRSCYLSNSAITPDGESAKKFIANRIKDGHKAILEFSNVTVQFCVDRGLTHEFVRHRLCSFAQESSRYVNLSLEKNGGQITVVLPSRFIGALRYKCRTTKDNLTEIYDISSNSLDDHLKQDYILWYNGCLKSEEYYMSSVENDIKPENARDVLPQSTKAILNIGANFREWRHVFELRADKHAHPDMVYIMSKLLRDFKKNIPIIFDDIHPEII